MKKSCLPHRLRKPFLFTFILLIFCPIAVSAHGGLQVTIDLDREVYRQGDPLDVRVTALFKDNTAVTEAKKAEIVVRDRAGRIVFQGPLEKQGEGTFARQYRIAETARTGKWKAKVMVTAEGKKGTALRRFTVEEKTATDPTLPDNDGDGFSIGQGDCNDGNAVIFPGAAETCGDGIDQDCSGGDLPCPPPATDAHHGPECLGCHQKEATEVHASVHYQWQGDVPEMVNGPAPQGKMTNSLNSYCINILGNWAGCSACHVGKGAKPEPVATAAQLQNIDCLKCHGAGGVLPTRADCLKCHARAGGGDAVKRGDLALATAATTDRNYDVHMATTGANLNCIDCHTTQKHRIAGRGSDLRPTDLAIKIECSTCHGVRPHDSSRLNQHTARVACQTCHIPIYAKNAADTAATEATEIFRTWKETDAAAPPYHPAANKANDLVPSYRFWDGRNDNVLLGDVSRIDPQTGAYPTSRPVGSVQNGKLYPFKYKTAEQPMTTGSRQLIALDTSVFFATADADAAIQQGLINMGMSGSTPWEWVLTDTFQALNHQVGPGEQALQCNSCHGTTTRMDLQGELGYALKGARSFVCTQCHGSKENKPFTTLHDKHVRDKRFDCAWCHSFSRPERGLQTP